jgi:hypothetical protein
MDSSASTLRIMARGIYRTALPTGLRPRPRLPIHRRPVSSGVYSLSAGLTLQVMNAPSLRPRPVPPRPHLTEPVSREETLEISKDWLASAEP